MVKRMIKKIDESLLEFYQEADKATIENSLKEDIKTFEEYSKKKKQLIAQFKFTAKAKLNKQRDDRLLALAGKFEEAIKKNIDKPIAILKKFIQNNSSLALYRNLNKLSKEDIIEIIKDKNLVELLEQLDNDTQH
jgi:hypothetical protein